MIHRGSPRYSGSLRSRSFLCGRDDQVRNTQSLGKLEPPLSGKGAATQLSKDFKDVELLPVLVEVKQARIGFELPAMVEEGETHGD